MHAPLKNKAFNEIKNRFMWRPRPRQSFGTSPDLSNVSADLERNASTSANSGFDNA